MNPKFLNERELSTRQKQLAINYLDYLKFLDDEVVENNWVGVSLQLDQGVELQMKVNKYVDILNGVFQEFEKDDLWLIQHEYKSFPWLHPHQKETFPELASFFFNHEASFKMSGAIECKSATILSIAKYLIQYPKTLEYKNIEIINIYQPLIIKITHHLTIDLISDNEVLLRKITHNINLKNVNIVNYRK